jgi:Cathepsin propeptide inhibitor domain (I29)
LETLRYNIFIDNYIATLKHNERYAQGLETYQLGINKYSDMFHSEFLRKMTGYKGDPDSQELPDNQQSERWVISKSTFSCLISNFFENIVWKFTSLPNFRDSNKRLLDVFNLVNEGYNSKALSALPTSVNWTAQGIVAKVKDQGQVSRGGTGHFFKVFNHNSVVFFNMFWTFVHCFFF